MYCSASVPQFLLAARLSFFILEQPMKYLLRTAMNNITAAANATKIYKEAVRELWIVFALDFIVVTLAIAFHALGIGLLWNMKLRKFSNQRILLLHLSIVSLPNILLNAIAIYHKAHRMFFPEGFIPCYFIFHMAYILALVYIAFDGLLLVVMTLKYRVFITRLKLKVALIVLWCVAVAYGLMVQFASFANRAWYSKYSSYFYNGFVIGFTTFAYIFIVIKVLISSRN